MHVLFSLQTHQLIFNVCFIQLSTRLLQDGRHEELDELMAEKEEEQRREREAAEAEFDAEEAEHMKKLNQALDEERVDQLRAAQKDLLSKVLHTIGVFVCW